MNIYLDYAATTPLLPEVLDTMLPFLTENYGNASGLYPLALTSRKALEQARMTIANTLQVEKDEIYFTSGGSESDNWALIGLAFANQEKGRHLITTKIEHKAILNTCHFLETQGFEITYLDVDAKGQIELQQVIDAIRPDTIVISMMTANNEVGTLLPVKDVAVFAASKGIYFHTDAVQAYGHLPIYGHNFTSLSASGHKFGGPKGIGFLYLKNKTPILPSILGGQQENGRRAGTENIASIVGMAKAAQIAHMQMPKHLEQEKKLQNYFLNALTSAFPSCILNGSFSQRLSNNIHVTFPSINGFLLVDSMARKGICLSPGSACNTKSVTPSHVLLAMQIEPELATCSIRISYHWSTTLEQIDYTIAALSDSIKEIQGIY